MTRWLLAVVLFALFSETAFALRCNKRVVNEGYHKSRVYKLCGEPEFIEHKTEYIDSNIGIRNQLGGNVIGNQTTLEYDSSHLVPIHYEVWTYNFGRRRLVQHLKFRDGKLDQIEVGGYGY